jgi:hypothetical protein
MLDIDDKIIYVSIHLLTCCYPPASKNKPCRFYQIVAAMAGSVSQDPGGGTVANGGRKSQTDSQGGNLTVKSIKGGAVMGFLSGIFGPAHKQKNPNVRKEAAGRLTDKTILAEMAEKDEDQGVREEAKKRLQALA